MSPQDGQVPPASNVSASLGWFQMRIPTIVAIVMWFSTVATAARGQSPESADAAPQAAGGGKWLVGYAEADITPTPGQAMMAGFGRKRHVDGTLSPLRAQALVLRDAVGTTAVLVAADVLGFDRITVERIRHKIAVTHGIPGERVCLAASHTHWGPAINYRASFAIGGIDVWYLRDLEQKLLQIVEDALAQLSPAQVAYGACEAQVGMCRRMPNDRGQIVWGPYEQGSYDKHTPVLRIQRDASPKTIVLVGHACHPTSTGAVDKWSPDYPGAMRDRLEAELEGCRAMFVMGCGGDAKVVHRDPASNQVVFAASPEQSQAAGFRLAEAVLALLEQDRLDGLAPELSAKIVGGELPFQQPRSQEEIKSLAFDADTRSTAAWWARQSLAYPDPREAFPYEVQTWRLGELTLIAMEGEVCSEWGPLARSKAQTKHAMAVGYANNCAAYIPTARIIREGGYEGDTSHMAYFLPAPFDPKMEAALAELLSQAVPD